MPHQEEPTTIAILGAHALSEDILAQLLRSEGYATRLLQPPLTDPAAELLDGVDLLLLSPDLDAVTSGALLEAMRSTPKTADIPVLQVSPALKLALLDELEAGVPWRGLFEELLYEIETALTRDSA